MVSPPPIPPLLISYHLHLQLYHCSRQSGEPSEEVPINPMDAEPYDSKASPLLSTPKGQAKTGSVSTRATVTTLRRQCEPRPHFSMRVRRENLEGMGGGNKGGSFAPQHTERGGENPAAVFAVPTLSHKHSHIARQPSARQLNSHRCLCFIDSLP